MFRLQKLIRFMIWSAAFCFGLLMAVHLVLPYAVDTQQMRRRILAQAAAAFSGDIEYTAIKPALLPWPHAVITGGRVKMPGRFQGQFPKVILYVKLWPLVTGRLELDRFKLVEPDVRLEHAMPAEKVPKRIDLQSLQLLLQQSVEAFAAVTANLDRLNIEIKDGRLRQEGQTGLALSQLRMQASAEGHLLRIAAAGSSNLADGFELTGEMDLHTFDSRSDLRLTGLQTQRLKSLGLASLADRLPEAILALDIHLTSDGKQSLQARFALHTALAKLPYGSHPVMLHDLQVEGSAWWTPRRINITLSQLQAAAPGLQIKGTLIWRHGTNPSHMPLQINLDALELDIPELRAALLNLYGHQKTVQKVLAIVQGGKIPVLTLNYSAPGWSADEIMDRLHLQCNLTEGRIAVPDELFTLEQVRGDIEISKGKLTARHLAAKLGNTFAEKGDLVLGLFDGSQAFRLDTQVDADLAELSVLLPKIFSDAKARTQSYGLPPIEGRAAGRLILGERLNHLTAEIDAKAQVNTLDSAFNLTGAVKGLPGADTAARLSLKGRLGPQMMDWLGRSANAAPDLLVKAPVTITGVDIHRDPSGGLSLAGIFDLRDGLRATADLRIQAGELNLKRLHIKDGVSDAVLHFRRQRAGNVVDAGFKGAIDRSTMDKLFQQNRYLAGRIEGDFKVHLDNGTPAESSATGGLSIRNLEIPWKGTGVLHIEDMVLKGCEDGFEIPSAALAWDDQQLRLTGNGAFGREALDLKLQISADAWHAEKPLPSFSRDQAGSETPAWPALITMPVRTRAEIDVAQLDFEKYRLRPFQAVVVPADGQIRIDIASAGLCGIQMPGHIQIKDGVVQAEFKPQAVDSALQDTGGCLVGAQYTERLVGTVDVDGTMATSGQTRDQFIQNLKGKVHLKIRDGRIYNVGSAGFFTNLLSFLSVNQYIKGGLPDLSKNDFQYQSIDTQLVFQDGSLLVKEGVLKSNAVNMVADGRYRFLNRQVDLVMLVSPLTTVDWIVERIPILGNILQGTLVAIPVGVKGPAFDPKVLPLAPSAIGSRLGGILKRTVKTPFRIIEPILKDHPDPNSTP